MSRTSERKARLEYYRIYHPTHYRLILKRRAKYAFRKATMTAPRRLTAYPDWLVSLADSFEQGQQEVVLTLASPEVARLYRQQIYGFLKALEREKMLGNYPAFQTVRLVIRGNELHIMHVDKYLPRPEGF